MHTNAWKPLVGDSRTERPRDGGYTYIFVTTEGGVCDVACDSISLRTTDSDSPAGKVPARFASFPFEARAYATVHIFSPQCCPPRTQGHGDLQRGVTAMDYGGTGATARVGMA